MQSSFWGLVEPNLDSQLGHESLRQTRDALADHGLKPRQLRILDLLADRGPIGQRELGELMAIDHSVLVNMLNPLEEDRLVKRERDTADRRRHLVTITAAGHRRLAAADEAFREAEDAFFAALTKKQRAQLREILLTVRNATRAQVNDDFASRSVSEDSSTPTTLPAESVP